MKDTTEPPEREVLFQESHRLDKPLVLLLRDSVSSRADFGSNWSRRHGALHSDINIFRVNVDDYLSLTRIRHKASDERLVQLLRRAAKAAAEQAGLRQIRGVADLYDLVNDGMPAFVEVLKEG